MNGTHTMNLSRRHLLATTSALSVAALAGCAGKTVSQLALDLQGYVNAGQALVSNLPTGTVPAQATADLTVVNNAAAAVTADPTTATGTLATQVVRAVEDALPILAPIVASFAGPAAPIVLLAFGALKAFAPVIAAEFGVAGAAMAALAMPTVAALPTTPIDQARALYWPKVAK